MYGPIVLNEFRANFNEKVKLFSSSYLEGGTEENDGDN
jgi:hypothetical protein